MLAEAHACGVAPAEFWRMTPREFAAVCEGARERRLRELEDGMTVAWWNAAFQRAKRLPDLAKVHAGLRDPVDREPQTPDEMLRIMIKSTRALGGDVHLPPAFADLGA